MQATTLQNMSRARGIEADVSSDGSGSVIRPGGAVVNRRQIVAARKLKRYISQLSYAKSQCEAKLAELGWDGPFPSHDSENSKVISFLYLCAIFIYVF